MGARTSRGSREGEVVGAYRVGAPIVNQRAESLYRATNATTGDDVVIGFVAAGKPRFDRKAARAPHLAKVIDAGEDGAGGQFVVMSADGADDDGAYALASNAASGEPVPDLELPVPSARRSPPSSKETKDAKPSLRGPLSSKRGPSAAAPAAYGMLDFDNGIEDSEAAAPIALADVPRSSTGLGRELAMGPGGAFVSRRKKSPDAYREEPSTDRSIVRGTLRGIAVLVLVGGASFALLKFIHLKIDWNLLDAIPSAIDGSSMKFSGVAALVGVALCFGAGILSIYSKPRSWGMLITSLGFLAIAIAMIIVTLTTTPAGEVGPKPDGSFLVPWAMPFLPLGFSMRACASAWRRFDDGTRGIALGVAWSVGAAVAIFLTVHLLQVVKVSAMLGLPTGWF